MNATDEWNDTQAFREDWYLSWPDETIQAYRLLLGETTWGQANQRALAFVQKKAAEGSAYHIEALARTQLL